MIEPSDAAVLRTTKISLRVVECLKELDGGRVEEVADYLDIASSTAHRHLQTLRQFSYVVKRGDEYHVGLQFLTMGGYARDQIPSIDLARSAVDDIAAQTGERSQFLVEEQGRRVFLYTASGENAVRAEAKIGRRGPLHTSAAGKAILAEFPDKEIRRIVDRDDLPATTENTITEFDELMEELDQIRDRGVAFNWEESTPGLRAVATAVRAPDGTVFGALSVSGPAHRFEGDRFESEFPGIVRGIAHELELNMKYE